jgi:hypothetical protein
MISCGFSARHCQQIEHGRVTLVSAPYIVTPSLYSRRFFQGLYNPSHFLGRFPKVSAASRADANYQEEARARLTA